MTRATDIKSNNEFQNLGCPLPTSYRLLNAAHTERPLDVEILPHQDPEDWATQGLNHMEQSNFQAAAHSFAKSLEQSPLNPRFLWLNAWCADHRNDEEQCYAYLNQYLVWAKNDSTERKEYARQRVLKFELLRYKSFLVTVEPSTMKSHPKAVHYRQAV